MIRNAEGPDRRPVVVGVDGSSTAMNAVRWAAYLAAGLRTSLTVLSAEPVPHPRHQAVLATSSAAAGVLGQAVALARTCTDHLRIDGRICSGPADSALIEASARARLVIVGAQSVHHSRLIGPTTSHVTIGSQCPVGVWRGVAGRPIPRHDPVLVGVDGTEIGDHAVGCAFELASALEVGVVAVHAWAPGIAPLGQPDGAAAARALLSRSVAPWRARFPDVEVHAVAAAGNTIAVLAARSANAQMLVLGSRGRTAAAAVLLGSTSRDMLHRALCPVLVCGNPPRPDDRGQMLPVAAVDRRSRGLPSPG